MKGALRAVVVLLLVFPFQQRVLLADKPERSSARWQVDLSLDEDFGRRLLVQRDRTMMRPGLRYLNAETAVVIFNDNVFQSNDDIRRTQAIGGLGVLVQGPRSFMFHAIFIDPADGSIKGKLSWDTKHEYSNLVPLEGGGFLVLAGETLLRYSRSLKLLQKLDVTTEFALEERDRSPSSAEDHWRLEVSPDLKVAALAHVHWRGGTTFTLLDTASLRSIGRIEAFGFRNHYSVVDETIARPSWYSVELLTPTGERVWSKELKGYNVSFLDNGHLIVASQRGIVLAGVNGNVMGRTSTRDAVNVISIALDVPRFAVASTEIRNGGWNFVVQAFDWKPFRQVSERVFSKPAARAGWDAGFNQASIALSPSGSQLLVLRDNLLELFPIEHRSK